MLEKGLMLLFVTIVIVFLYRYFKSLKLEPPKKEQCRIKLSKPKFKKTEDKKFACFNMFVNTNHTFFIDFPILFRFYSISRFKSRIKITYSTYGSEPEEIINKQIVYETTSKEHKYYITDIIVGKITFEIEVSSDYGNPIIEFEILKNSLCEIDKDSKLKIKFLK